MSQQSVNSGTLRLINGEQIQANSSFSLPVGLNTILGRDPSCDIVLDAYSMVSRRHAAIRFVQLSRWIIQDLNSANGVYVNGQRIQGEWVLSDRDRIRLGENGPEFQFEFGSAQLAILAIGTQPRITSQTIDERRYRIEIQPTKLRFEVKQESLNFAGNVMVAFGIVFSISFVVLFLPSIISPIPFGSSFFLWWLAIPPIIMLFFLLRREDFNYLFDRESGQLTFLRASYVERVMLRRHLPQHYLLQEFVAVRVQRSNHRTEDGVPYSSYSISLDRTNGKPLRLNHHWNNFEKAEEVANIIDGFLMRS